MSLRFVQTLTPSFDDAACKRHPNTLWFDEDTTREAITVCRDECPIRTDCLNYALTLPVDTEGVWAGFTKKELAPLRRKNGNPPVIDHGTLGGYEKHRRHRVPMCQACQDANSRYQREHRPSRAKIPTRKETQP